MKVMSERLIKSIPQIRVLDSNVLRNIVDFIYTAGRARVRGRRTSRRKTLNVFLRDAVADSLIGGDTKISAALEVIIVPACVRLKCNNQDADTNGSRPEGNHWLVLIFNIVSQEIQVGEGCDMELENHPDLDMYTHALRLLGRHLRPDVPQLAKLVKRFPSPHQHDAWNCGVLAIFVIGQVLEATRLNPRSYTDGVVLDLSQHDCNWLRLALAVEVYRAARLGCVDVDVATARTALDNWLPMPNVIPARARPLTMRRTSVLPTATAIIRPPSAASRRVTSDGRDHQAEEECMAMW